MVEDSIADKLVQAKTQMMFCMKQLIYVNQRLIRIIERATKYNPPSNKYQLEFLEQIDKQLAAGQSEASFWKEKLVLQKVES